MKKFVEAGFELPKIHFTRYREIECNKIATINYLVENGYSLIKDSMFVRELIGLAELTTADFENYLDHGLPLHFYRYPKSNWLDMALEKGRFDIAALVYKKGLRFSKTELELGHSYEKILDIIEIFVRGLAMSAAFEKASKVMYAGNMDDESILSLMPKEMVDEVAKSFFEFELEVEGISDDLYQ